MSPGAEGTVSLMGTAWQWPCRDDSSKAVLLQARCCAAPQPLSLSSWLVGSDAWGQCHAEMCREQSCGLEDVAAALLCSCI